MRTLSGFLLGMGLVALQSSQGSAQPGAVPPIPTAPTPVPIAAPAPAAPVPVPISPPVQIAPPQGLPPVGLPNPAVAPPMPYTGQQQSWQMPAPANTPIVQVQVGPQLGPPVPGIPPPPGQPAPLLPPPPPPNPVNLWAGPAGWNALPPQQPGWYVEAGFDVLDPEVRNHLDRTVTLPNGISTTVALPGQKLDWTAMPEFEVGYRLPDGLGTFAVGYRFLVTDGRVFLPAADGTDELRSRLDVNIFDFDYVTRIYEPFPRLEMQARIGARLGLSYYDTSLTGTSTDVRESNYYTGAGPHAALELNRRIALIPGLSVGGKIDGAILIGQDKTDFLASGFASNGSLIQGTNNMRGTTTSEMLALEVGLNYKIPDLESLRFSTGYRYEQWWDMGRANGTSLDLTTNGFFFRVEYGF